MEERKFDPYQFIGFILIALILTWMLYRNGPEPETSQAVTSTEQTEISLVTEAVRDSIEQQQKVVAYGNLGRLFTPTNFPDTKLLTQNMALELQSKGGIISKLALKEFENYEDQPLPLIQDENTDFNITLKTKDGRIINTKDLYFTPSAIEKEDAFYVQMKAELTQSQYLEYEYVLPKSGYLFTVNFKTVGMEDLLDSNQNPKLNWTTDVYRNSRSIDYENRYTEFTFGYEEDRVDYLSLSGEDQETREGIRWISYRQHFFSAILIPEKIIAQADIRSKDLSSEAALEEKFTKRFETFYELPSFSGNVNSQFEFYYGPSDYKTLKSLKGDLETSIPMGWGIFGWINRVIFLPLFGFLSSFLSYGIAIIVMTIIVRLAM